MAYSNPTGLPSVTDVLKPYIDTEWFTDEARERGTVVHNACAAHLQGLYVCPLRKEYQPYFDSFRRWADKMLADVALVEKRLSNIALGYCGQPDLIAMLKGDDCYGLFDLKTALSKQGWWRLQGAAYRDLAQHNDIETCRGGSLRLKPDGKGCLLDPWPDNYRKDFTVFIGTLNAYNFFNGRKK